MNRHRASRSPVGPQGTDVTTWPLGQPIPRARRYRRLSLDHRSDVVLSALMFLLLIWMAFVALTLWH